LFVTAITKGLSTPGNKVAENGNKLLPETTALTGAATMLPFRATNCCRKRHRQQFVAWCGQALRKRRKQTTKQTGAGRSGPDRLASMPLKQN